MSIFRQRSANLSATLAALGMPNRSSVSSISVTSETSLRHSAVWACLRLRADLISTTPVDVFRRVAGVQVEMSKPPLLVTPSGYCGLEEWLYSSQFDLDRFGNAFGIITERDGVGYPSRIDLVSAESVTVVVKDGDVTGYRVGGMTYDARDIWHERQYTVAGLHVGLSPIAYAAYSIGTYLSAQEFALDWFGSGAAPSGHLRNTLVPSIDPADATAIKSRFKNAVKGRDLLVTGRDWEYTMASVPANTTMFLDEMKYGVADVCRFLGVPGDLIDAETSTGSVTYASISQRNLQLLIMNLGPAFVRREKALSRALPAPRYVKFNTDATVLRMDPAARGDAILARVAGKTLAPSEARELDNLPPFTPEQVAEFDALFAPRAAAPMSQNDAPVINVDSRTYIDGAQVDARTEVTVPERSVSVEQPAIEVHNNYEIDARTEVADGAVRLDSPTTVNVPERSVDVHMPEAPAPVLTRKRIETDDKGRIVGVIEEPA